MVSLEPPILLASVLEIHKQTAGQSIEYALVEASRWPAPY
jgi:hypothetical protein